MKQYGGITLIAIACALTACGGGGSVPTNAGGGTTFVQSLGRNAVLQFTLPAKTIGEELPGEGVGTLTEQPDPLGHSLPRPERRGAPHNKLLIHLVSARATTTPIATPTIAIRAPDPMTIPSTFSCCAPNASRIPISRRRCDTVYDSTP